MSETGTRTVTIKISVPGRGWEAWAVEAAEMQIQACYDLPRDACRAAYWSKIMGDPLPEGTALVWTV